MYSITFTLLTKSVKSEIVMLSIHLPGHSNATLVDSIVWLKGEGSYTRVNFLDNTYAVVTRPLVWFEHHLDFIRVNRSALVSQAHIGKFCYSGSRSGEIQLLDGTMLSVSRSRLGYLTAILNDKPNEPFLPNQSTTQI